MMARTTSVIMQNLVEIERRTSAWEDKCDVFHFVCLYVCVCVCLFVNNARTLNGHKWRSCVIQEIASVFVGLFRWGLQLFFREEKPFSVDRTDLKIVARWRYDWCTNARKKIQNLRKWVQSLCAPLRPFKNEMKENSYHSILPHALLMCTRIKIFCYLVTGCHQNQKLSSS